MTITKETAIELAKEAGWDYYGIAWQVPKIHRLCNLAAEHAAKDVEPVKTPAHHAAVRKVLKHHKLTDVGDGVIEADLIYAVIGCTRPAHDDTALLRQCLDALNLAHPYIKNKAEREQSWAAFTALRERLGEKA